MQDPNDPGTLCLIEAARRPLTNAERQARRRQRLARERAAGQRIPLGDVSLTELQALKALVGAAARDAVALEAMQDAELLHGLLKRLTAAQQRATGLDN